MGKWRPGFQNLTYNTCEYLIALHHMGEKNLGNEQFSV